MDNQKLDFRWFKQWGLYLALLLIAYLVLHYAFPAYELNSLTEDEKSTIASMVPDSSLASAPDSRIEDVAGQLVGFIESRYDLYEGNGSSVVTQEGEQTARVSQPERQNTYREELTLQLANFVRSRDLQFLNTLRIKSKSLFWLSGTNLYLEMIFWSLFGVIGSLFYYVSEAKRTNSFRSEEQYSHYAKLVYAPFSVVVIFLSIDLLTGEGVVGLANIKYGVVVLSFILGFYSGRTIELLDRIKHFVLPGAKKKMLQPPINTEPTKEIAEEAIVKFESDWRTLYPGVQGIKAIVADGETYQIQFSVLPEDFDRLKSDIPTLLYSAHGDGTIYGFSRSVIKVEQEPVSDSSPAAELIEENGVA